MFSNGRTLSKRRGDKPLHPENLQDVALKTITICDKTDPRETRIRIPDSLSSNTDCTGSYSMTANWLHETMRLLVGCRIY